MREILFRGKKTTNGEWVVGNYARNVFDAKFDTIEDCENFPYLIYGIDRDTVGQYTGLTDKNGKRIFEADLVMFRSYTEPCEIAWDQEEARWFMKFSDCYIYFDDRCIPKDFEVIGNIHDNPELLAEVEG